MYDKIIQDVAELPDRTSPDNWPDAMIVTADELRSILQKHLGAEGEAVDAPDAGWVLYQSTGNFFYVRRPKGTDWEYLCNGEGKPRSFCGANGAIAALDKHLLEHRKRTKDGR